MKMRDEFQPGDVLVRIGDFGEWLVDKIYMDGYNIKPIIGFAGRAPILGAGLLYTNEYAIKEFVKVRRCSHWKYGETYYGE